MSNFDNFKLTKDPDEYTKLQMYLNYRLSEKAKEPLDLDKAILATQGYIQRDSKSHEQMNLDRLRSDIQAKHQEFQTAAGKVSEREETLKKELNRIAQAKNVEDSELLLIMSDLENKRLAEVKALKEKELVSRALKDLDKKNLNALEYQKKMQMKGLKEERDTLQKKEDELFKELERMQARLLDDEERIRKAKNEIAAGVVTVKDPNEKELEMKIEELSNMRGKEVLAVKGKKEELELQKMKIENDLRALQRGELGRRNNSGILAGGSILTPLNLEERRNLPLDIVRENEKWKNEYEKLNQMKKMHEEYVKNEPMYDVKPAGNEGKPKFVEEMREILKQVDSELRPGDRARVLEYIKEDIEHKDLKKPPKNDFQPKPQSPAPQYNSAQYKLSSEPINLNPAQNLPNDIFSNQSFEKYKQEAKNKFFDEYGIPRDKVQSPYPQSLMKRPSYPQNTTTRYPQTSPNNHPPYPEYPHQYPNPYPYNPTPKVNPETEKLKKELKSLKKQLKNPKPQQGFQITEDFFPELEDSNLPEGKLLNGIMNQEHEDLRMLAALSQDPELYRAKMEHFKEMSAIRAKMEASLQELTLQRMRRSSNKEEIQHNRVLTEELLKAEQRKMQIMANLKPDKEYKDYYPEKGIFIAWELLTGVPQRCRKVQLVYGVYEKGEVRLEPRLVLQVVTETDPFNGLAFRGRFGDVHDIKRLPPLNSILAVIEVQGIDSNQKVSVVGWTALELFTPHKTVFEGYWRVPIYKPPTINNIYLSDIKSLAAVPNAYVYLRIYAADNAPNFPSTQDLTHYHIPSSHSKELQINYLDSNRSEPNKQSYMPNKIPSRNQSKLASQISNRNSTKGTKYGIVIKLESLNNFRSRSHLKFKLTIVRSSEKVIDDRGGYCIWTSEPVNSQNADVSILSSRNSDKNNIQNSEIHINRQTFFLKDFLDYQHQIDWSEELVLLVEILERNSRKLSVVQGGLTSPVDDFFPVAWTLYVISDTNQRKMNFSTVELDLFKPPIPNDLALIEHSHQIGGSIKLTVQDMSENTAQQLKQPSPVNLTDPFLESLQPQWDDGKLFAKGDGIDIYVDGARFLPDNTSCTKIVVKAFNSKIEPIGLAMAGLGDLNSPAFSPSFGFRTEYRTPVFDPTTILVISIITIDTAHNEVRLIGYSAINLFLHKYKKTQPTDPNEEEFILNSGAFQLPIYCQEPFRREPFNLEVFNQLELMPCATVLMRIREAPKAQQGVRVLSIKDVPKSEWYIRGVIVPPPKYEQRAYNTSFCMPNPAEREIYMERAKKKSPTVGQATYNVLKSIGEKLDMDEEELMDWIDNKLNSDPHTSIVDLKYFARYNKKLGFKISIDALHHASSLMPFVVIVSINPPGSFYTTSVISQDIQLIDHYDWNSFIDTPCFIDGFQTFKNVEFNQYLHIVVDIRQVNLTSRSLSPVAWTIIPVFFPEGYVKSGIYQSPLFSGPVPYGLLNEMTTQEPWPYLLNASKKSGGPKYFQSASILFRLIDSQREGHFNKPLDLNRIDYSYIPKDVLGKFSYNSAGYQKNNEGNILRSSIKGNMSPANYSREVHDIVVTSLDLPHLN